MPGIWNTWHLATWESTPTLPLKAPAKYVMTTPIFRIKPGAAGNVEKTSVHRYSSRFLGVRKLIVEIDEQRLQDHFDRRSRIPALQISKSAESWLEVQCEEIAKQPIPLITDKTILPPSQNRQDYFSHMRYLHKVGDKYEKIDGVSNPAAIIGTDESRAYDRTSLYECLHHATALTLSGKALKRPDHLQRATDILDKWFIAADTCMNPHGRYAQLNFQMTKKLDFPGLIDFRDLWILPLLIELLASEDALTTAQQATIRDWMQSFQEYLMQTEQGKTGITATNNIATWIHLLRLSFALHAEQLELASSLIRQASLRFSQQCGKLGWQQEEMQRSNPLHYSLFNATGWVLMSGMLRQTENDFWQFEGVNGESVTQLLLFIQQNLDCFPDYTDRPAYYDDWLNNLIRLVPLDALGQARLKRPAEDIPILQNDPNTGLPPFWFCYLPLSF